MIERRNPQDRGTWLNPYDLMVLKRKDRVGERPYDIKPGTRLMESLKKEVLYARNHVQRSGLSL